MRITILALFLLLTATNYTSADYLGVYKPYRNNTLDYLLLRDFCTFKVGTDVYVASMKKMYSNEGIIVARSADCQGWQSLGDAVSTRSAEDASMVWAPHVVEDKGVYYMFYTGVSTPTSGQWCQRSLVASTADPSNPALWQRNTSAQFIVDGLTQNWFRPSHSGAVWNAGAWADCRDPMVLKEGNTWYLFYSGADTTGGICGVATASSILGPWTDRGAVLRVTSGIPESCFVLKAPDGTYFMTMNHSGAGTLGGTKTARATSLVPVSGQPSFTDLRLMSETTGQACEGWAHDFIPGANNTLICANLTGYWVNFKDAYWSMESYGWNVVEQPPVEAPMKMLPDNHRVYQLGMVITALFSSDGCFYMEDKERSSGIRVAGSLTGLAIGDVVNVSGTMNTRKVSGYPSERQITATIIQKTGSVSPLLPLIMTSQAIGGGSLGDNIPGVDGGSGLNNIGMLVTHTGRVTSTVASMLWLDDGGGIVDPLGYSGIMVRCPSTAIPATAGDTVSVIGIVEGSISSGSTANRRCIRIRGWGDFKRTL